MKNKSKVAKHRMTFADRKPKASAWVTSFDLMEPLITEILSKPTGRSSL